MTNSVRRVAIIASLLVGAAFSLRASTSSVSASTAVSTVKSAHQHLQTQNIEDIRLGQRVVGTNPIREQTHSPSDVNPQTWRAIRLRMVQHGVEYDLAFLRPMIWLRQVGAQVGGTIPLELSEMGLNGPAEVVAIDPCPPIEPDDGSGRNVVTGTMAHAAENILYLDITGLDEPLGVTDTHPIWSETRQEFVIAGKLEFGEQFPSLTGKTAQLTSIMPHRGPREIVFNLEVDAEHVYAVASNGLLVHNSCFETLTDGANSAHVLVNDGVAEIEIGFIEDANPAFINSIKKHLADNEVTKATLNTGPIVNTDLAIGIGRRWQKGRTYFGGNVDLISGGKNPVFQIIWEKL